MLASDIDELPASAFSTAVMPIRKKLAVSKNPVDIGFDAEWDRDLDMLLSYQFSTLVDGQLKSHVFILNRVGGITASEFAGLIKEFLRLNSIELPKSRLVYLISHAAAAELKYITDGLQVFRLKQLQKGLGWEGEVDGLKIRVIDDTGFYPGFHLSDIGTAIGYPKLSLEADDKDHKYWIGHMKELQDKHRDLFDKYAVTDAEIVILAWKQLCEKYVPRGCDPHRLRTITSLAMVDFKTHWLKHLPVPVYESREIRWSKLKSGEYSKRPKIARRFAGNFESRWLSLEAYWGGYNMAFARGYRKEHEPFAVFLDVISLYVAAGILQPLPNADTAWVQGNEALQRWRDLEGFGRFKFQFPPEQKYPNMPVMITWFPKLTFPLSGETVCTIAEARVAEKLGATLEPIRVVGFRPGEGETNHDLGAYLRNVLAEKNRAEKGTLAYTSAKLTMVSLIGKLAFRSDDYGIADILDFVNKTGLSYEGVRSVFLTPRSRWKLKNPRAVGNAWIPEWASLTLGKARAVMGEIVACGCYLISTDGGLFPLEALPKIRNLDCVKQLEEVHSGLVPEADLYDPAEVKKLKNANPRGLVDEMWIGRSRMYGTWLRGLEVHSAHQSVYVDGREWSNILRKCIGADGPVVTDYEAHRLASPKDVVLRGTATRLFDDITETKHLGWQWDNKRALPADYQDGVFSDFVETSPHVEIDAAVSAEKPWRVLHGGDPKNPAVDALVEEHGISRATARQRLSRSSRSKEGSRPEA